MSEERRALRVGVGPVWDWLVTEWRWPSGALLVTAFLVALLPVLYVSAGLATTLVFAQLPAYLIHQWEEHASDRFRSYFNDRFGSGRELLTPTATFWINCLGVWLLDAASLYAAVWVAPAAGLAAAYLSVVNSVSHVGQAVRLREYNPGLLSAITLLLPVGCWAIVATRDAATASHHAIAIAIAVGLHLAIIVYCRLRIGRVEGE